MISALRTYELYLAIVNHFNPKRNYDFFKYGGKTRITQDSLDKRTKDKFFFEILAEKATNEEYVIGYLVANILKGNSYIRHMKVDDYNLWLKYRDAIVYNFANEMDTYINCKNSRRKNSDTPMLIELVYADVLSKEFIILWNLALNGALFKQFDLLKDNLLWEELKKKLLKYQPFIVDYWHVDQNILSQLQKKIRNSLTTLHK